MNAFFYISGLLSALTITRLTPFAWLKNRLRVIGVALAFGLLILNPLFFTIHEIFPKTSFMEGFTERNSFNPILHLWFLFSILAFSIATVGATVITKWMELKIEISREMFLDKNGFSLKNFLLLFAIVVASYLAHKVAYKLTRVTDFGVLAFVIISSIKSSIFFFLGFFTAFSHRIRRLFSSKWYLLIGLMSIPTILIHLGALTLDSSSTDIWSNVGETSFSLFFILLTMPFFVKIDKISNSLKYVSRSSYTTYMVHMLIISMLLYIFSLLGAGVYVSAIASIIVTFAISIALHFALVERIPLLALLLNGRKLSRK